MTAPIGESAAAASPVDSEALAAVGERVPVMAVLTVGGRWVACMVTDAGVTGGFRTWQGVPEDADLRRSEVSLIWSDVPPWSPAIGLIRFPDELAAGQWAECRHCGAWSPPGEDHSCSCPNSDDERPIHPPGTVG